MATIRKRNSKWQVTVRRKGFKSTSKSFILKSDAEEWARMKECQADRADFQFDVKRLDYITWKELLEQYRDIIVSKKKSHLSETNHINAYLKRCENVVNLRLSQIKPYHFSEYRDRRLKEVKPATICRELGIFRHAFEIAKTEWGYPIAKNPVAQIRKPRISNRRDRRISPNEYSRILRATNTCTNSYIKPIIMIAVNTAMRRGEILNIQGKHINFDKRTLHIPDTKTGRARTIPLPLKTLNILKQHYYDGLLFPLSANAFRLSWDRVLVRASVTGLKFHDTRHEAISRFFERGLSVPEVALISGHLSVNILINRYTHIRAENIARKL